MGVLEGDIPFKGTISLAGAMFKHTISPAGSMVNGQGVPTKKMDL